jgi:type IV fimbrial biogenesis protein FimT
MDGRDRRRTGTTLLELLVALTIIAILGTIAAPSLANLRRNAVLTAVVNDVVHSIHLARSEAIKRNAVVSICRTRDGTRCANASRNWNDGWIVFINIDADQPADTDPGEPILWRHEALATGELTSNRQSFSFRPFGQADVNGTLVYCGTKGSIQNSRAIIISHTGRPRTSDRDASGKPLKC